MHDVVPNFAGQPTIRSIRSGAWSSVSTWSLGRLPNAQDIVSISGGTTVTIDGTSPVAAVIGVESNGRMAFRTDINTRLTVGTLQVLPQGTLEVGTASAPIAAAVTAEIVIANRALDLMNDGVGVFDPRQFGTAIVVTDGRVTMFGAAKTAFVRLASEPAPGTTTLRLESPATGWRAGDRLVLPDSRHISNSQSAAYTFEGEQPVVSSVSADGLTVSLASALLYAHPGARDGNDVLEFLPHVGSLTRNVVVRSEAPTGTRGHVFFTERSEVELQYASFRNLGRATVDPIDSTTFDAQGNVLHMGTNHIGRYPLHFHHVLGSTNSPASGYQFTVKGNVVDDDATINRHKWAMVIHASHYGLINNNVVNNAGGWGIGTEDGSESFNEFTSNFIVKVRGEGTREQAEGGNGMWFRGPNNYVRDNVVANVRGSMIEGSHGIQYYFIYLGTICVPNFRGADPHGQCTNYNANALPLLEFASNEVYGAMEIGLSFWWVGSDAYTPFANPGSVIKDFRVWHFSLYGTYGYPASKVTFDGYVARGKKSVLSNSQEFLRGIWFSDYMMHDTVIRNADIQNMRDGIMAPYFSKGTTIIEDSYLRNANNIKIVTIGAPGSLANGALMPPKQTIIDNVRFAQVNGSVGGVTQYDIYMNYWLQFGSANLVKRDAVFVYNYNGVAGDDFQVFYNEQAPNFIMPQSSGNLVGSPVAGLTNSQNWATYGVAIAGEVATNTVSRSRIYGLVRLGTPQLTPDPPVITTITPGHNLLSVSFTAAFSGVAAISNYQYSLDAGTTWVARSPAATTSPLTISGLVNGTTYLVKIRAVNANGVGGASNQVSAKPIQAPTALTQPATNVTATSATLNATVNPNGSATVALFDYGMTVSYGSTAVVSPAPGPGFAAVAARATLSALDCDTLYHFRISTTSGATTVNGSDLTFRTAPCAVTMTTSDFDGDAKGDIAVYRPSTGEWLIKYSALGYVAGAGTWQFQWGLSGDQPIPADYDGDGKADLAVYRPSTGQWYLRYSSLGYVVGAGNWTMQWGLSGDQPIPADYDGDGRADLAVYRQTTGQWYIRYSSFGYLVGAGNWTMQWGLPGDTPIAQDFDGDGKADLAVYRPSDGNWFVRYSAANYAVGAGGIWTLQWGLVGDKPVPGDFDGDNRSDFAVYRPATGDWFIRYSSLGYVVGAGTWRLQWGLSGDMPRAVDFDGDGRTDVAVFRPATAEWYLRNSRGGYAIGQGNWHFQWGTAGDKALPTP